ncbi:ADP-ribosylglycohydrolase family protein [Streptomyces sp. NPDC059477]|uniref:ADP-ribosylglycohydrolase family protein n=1 Tax=Streptomyces sp. NPDC059477 TaxID=3346847 RepID=UPI0036B750A4
MEYISPAEQLAGITQEPWGLARNELEQAAESGKDVTAFRERLSRLAPDDEALLLELYEEILAAPAPADWPYFEGSDLDDILRESPADHREAAVPERLADRMRGAWFGRIAGNMVGKPVEIGPTRATIRAYLDKTNAYPLTDYVPYADYSDVRDLGLWGEDFWFTGATKGHVHGSVRDDDIDYTILGLHLLETYGTSYTSWDVAHEWLSRFPAYQLFTAERATYQNLVREIPLTRTGEHHNPYREWIGALIRADIYGYVAPGDPRRAAVLSYQDAILSHRANGVYGEMWAAALIASAFTAKTAQESLLTSLEHIPTRSRLAEELRTVLDDFTTGLTWDQSIDKLEARYPRMSMAHTLNNAGALAAAILWGGGDFMTTVALSVQAGIDTDSIGATAGSWAGAFAGYDALPAHLIDPLEDTCRSAVFGFGESSISGYADRTLKIVTTASQDT